MSKYCQEEHEVHGVYLICNLLTGHQDDHYDATVGVYWWAES